MGGGSVPVILVIYRDGGRGAQAARQRPPRGGPVANGLCKAHGGEVKRGSVDELQGRPCVRLGTSRHVTEWDDG